MINVMIMQYWNDYHNRKSVKTFEGLNELSDWIFEQMQTDYSSVYGKRLLSFPECSRDDGIHEIFIRPDFGCSYVLLVKQIRDTRHGILFSDGTFTAGRKYCTEKVRAWLRECRNRQENPEFDFAPDGTQAPGA